MPMYIALCKWTTQGMQTIKESPTRLDAGRKAFAGTGVQIKEFYMVMGEYDMVIVVEAADDAVYARATLMLAASGNIQTETLRAFTEDEYRSIVLSLP
jgi:uncharacterized protein with GYD domain